MFSLNLKWHYSYREVKMDEFIGNEHLKRFGIRNNCITKSLRIWKEARRRGIPASLIMCFSIPNIGFLHWISPHMYCILDGEMVDVAVDPETESRFYIKNDIPKILPVNITGLVELFLRPAVGGQQHRG